MWKTKYGSITKESNMKTDKMKIQDMLKKVAERKTFLAQLQGEKKQIQKQMVEEGCKTIGEIKKEIKKEEEKVQKIEKEFQIGIENLETNYNWQVGI